MPVTEQTYRAIALEDPEGQWELHRGRLREKPQMTWRHNDGSLELGFQLRAQLNRDTFRVRVNSARVHRQDETYYIPDVFVVPTAYGDSIRDRSDVLEAYERPLPLVIEIWSPSTGDYDVDTKFAEYQRRGDLEFWRLHPFERTLTRWIRRDDGTYAESVVTSGTVSPQFLPDVGIDFDALFE